MEVTLSYVIEVLIENLIEMAPQSTNTTLGRYQEIVAKAAHLEALILSYLGLEKSLLRRGQINKSPRLLYHFNGQKRLIRRHAIHTRESQMT